MIKSVRTVVYPLADTARGKAWYSEVLGGLPHFDEPCDLGFAARGFELGRIPDGAPGTGGPVAYWGVEEAAAGLPWLRKPRAEVPQELTDSGSVRLAAPWNPGC